MLIERLLSRCQQLGSGSYSAVFDTNDGYVLKVPLRQYDGPASSRFGTLRERVFTARSLYESTMYLREQMGDIILPVTMGPGGTLRQKKVVGNAFYTIPQSKRQVTIATKVSELIDMAFEIMDRAPKSLRLGGIDSSRGNFMFSGKDFENMTWYDPFVPSANPFAPFYKENHDSENF
jgi:hypothetical protein